MNAILGYTVSLMVHICERTACIRASCCARLIEKRSGFCVVIRIVERFGPFFYFSYARLLNGRLWNLNLIRFRSMGVDWL